MTSQYDATSTRVLATITAKGAPVVFLADAWRGGSIVADVTGSAIEIPGDPDTYTTLGVVQSNPVTLMVAGSGLSVYPGPGVRFTWAGRTYTVTLPTPTGPDGTPIFWTVVGAS